MSNYILRIEISDGPLVLERKLELEKPEGGDLGEWNLDEIVNDMIDTIKVSNQPL